LGLTARYRHHA